MLNLLKQEQEKGTTKPQNKHLIFHKEVEHTNSRFKTGNICKEAELWCCINIFGNFNCNNRRQ